MASAAAAAAASRQLSIGIVGAGLGGLTAANAFLQRGFLVKLYDQAEHFIPKVGAGFGLSPNGQVCLSSLGLTGYREITHPLYKMVWLDNKTGSRCEYESDVMKQMLQTHGFGMAGCLRADLVKVLSEPVEEHLHYSHVLKSMHQDDGDEKVHLSFENGVEQAFDLVVGSDGIHSRVADLLKIDESPPVYSGANIFYGVIPDPDSVKFKNDILARDHTIVQGQANGRFLSFRVGGDDNKNQIWAVTYPADSPPADSVEWSADGFGKDLQTLLGEHYPAEEHVIHELVSATDRLMHFGLYYRKHKDTWSKGRVCLLGDACHATLPYAGQGANQAIEDAVVLADCLSENPENHEAAFQSYYETRSPRTKRIVQMADILDKLYHSSNPFVCAFRDFAIPRIMSGGIVYKQLEKELLEECPVKDYAKYRP